MASWGSANAALLVCLGAAAIAASAGWNTPAVHRANEVTLAGLRPGRDTIETARHRLGVRAQRGSSSGAVTAQCGSSRLSADSDSSGVIETVHISNLSAERAPCRANAAARWVTGQGIGIGSACSSVMRVYGPPDSRGPSTQDGKRLELLYYAFDWAGPDVPQVMEVLCTAEKDGNPGHVAEITLAAPSL
jgi:hypothetical protein